ncbi:MAG: DNA-3-methyladenine glycosylase I [Acidimicrobiales bacterium]|nr:DNA-3-methyladenine glycosylase I [Acidimicrobiales bacterium]
MTPPDDLVIGDDGLARCRWGASPPIYLDYHDREWGQPVTDEVTLFEKVCLEGFQAGLSWLTILRKRPEFRSAFHEFDPDRVAKMGPEQVDELLQNPGIVRHRGKIEATINNAQRLRELHENGVTLRQLFWGVAEQTSPIAPRTFADVPSITPESIALSKQLKESGFKFVGPTTCYAAMQAMGVVNDHLLGCHARAAVHNK